MAELHLRLEIRLTRGVARWGLVAGLMVLAAGELASESVTLTTYYPAPSGVYTQMITTGNTYLARDGGNVGIGTTSPTSKLYVNGTTTLNGNTTVNGTTTLNGNTTVTGITTLNGNTTINGNETVNGNQTVTGDAYQGQTYLTNSDIYFTNTAHNHTGIGNTAGYAAIENAVNYNTLMILGRANGIGGGRSVSIWDRLDVNGRLEVTNGIVAKYYAGCYWQYYGSGTTTCGAGDYATLISGVLTKYQVINDYTRSQTPGGTVNSIAQYEGYMLCCNCPAGGCPAF